LLVQHGDTTAPDTSFVDMNTWTARHARKNRGEGVGSCAHILISTNETASNSQKYRFLAEGVTGISRSAIQRLLNHELKEACEGQVFYRDGKGNDKNLRPVGELLGIPSEQLIRAIEEGRLEDIYLVSHELIQEQDEVQYIREREKTLRLRVEQRTLGERALEKFNEIWRGAKEGDVRAMRLRFRENEKAQTVEINLEANSLEDTLFNKVSKVQLDTPLDPLTDAIRVDMVAQMVELLRQA
jgi:hypothetical protein